MAIVAIQGIAGSYSEEAARRLLGDECEIRSAESFAEAVRLLKSGKADHAVLPVENRIIGRIDAGADMIEDNGIEIQGETVVEVDHVLAGRKDAEFESIRSVMSHPAALGQCSVFFKDYPHLRGVECADTASGVRNAAAGGDATAAAIGSRRAAEIYGAKILRESIADRPDNWTRFYLIRDRK